MKSSFNLPYYHHCSDGIYRSDDAFAHRSGEYDESGFQVLAKMQDNHFWYRGRHHFLLKSVCYHLGPDADGLHAIDLGGGCGGWVKYLKDRSSAFSCIALADSSEVALDFASRFIPKSVDRIRVDLMNLKMDSRWDVAFLLDVIEHIPNDAEVIIQAAKSLKSGGLLFITTPALRFFWSYNDELAHHLRRYSKSDFVALADRTGMIMRDSRYFMFFLSPLYFLTRYGRDRMSLKEKIDAVKRAHNIPKPLLNEMLSRIFILEGSVGHRLSFPWGTSILTVLQKI